MFTKMQCLTATFLMVMISASGRVIRPHARTLSQQPTDAVARLLARSVNILTVPTIYSSFLTNGAPSIFPDDGTLNACYSRQTGNEGYNEYLFYSNTESTASSMASSFSLDASVWGDSITGSTSFTTITQTSEETSNLVSDRWQADNSYAISSSCLGSATLNPALVADWEGLRSNFTFDSYVNHDGAPSWAMAMGPCMYPLGQFQSYYVPECKLAYDFVQKWGTHVVTGLMTGSRALYWASALSTSSYSEQDFRASVCASVNGLGASVSTCAGISSQDIQAASSYNIHVTKFILGGVSGGASSQLEASNSPSDSVDYVSQFMSEAPNSTSPISYTLKSIWEMMAERQGADSTDQALLSTFNIIAKQSGWLFYPPQ